MLAGMPPPTVCVIIAAYNGERTIARAVASALREPEVLEVVVVDDASSDQSSARAADADDGSGRLRILRHDVNRGPSAARNLALRSSSAELVAVLDADDFIVPGRFARLFAVSDWDMIADNIAFIPEQSVPGFDIGQLRDFASDERPMTLAGFVEGNIPQPNISRGELGFLKPVIRREVLARQGLDYNEALRLGEDFVLYCQLLAAGARFRLIGQCGYVAVERAQSLSGRHRTADLAALAAAHDGLLRHPGLSAIDRRIVQRHRSHVLRKLGHRDFLDRKHARGFAHALFGYAARPRMLFGITCDIAKDKLFRRPDGAPESEQIPRYLFR
ncbi:glycosyltransferase family 2 protein [Sphingomonas sp. SRS2]|uniref:glycosyltransferase family 2 protein n=1 Tax=Sphingomonas sp. SRS2 TaxID=133190 RepID=UPI00061844D2|nr:glycosyltransferase family 2 protein [Sphingomonas sp. SRS2]KKC27888.1 glycosyl transferase [Sphingomonas sp. SRS2]